MKRVLFQMWDKSTQVPFLAQMSDGSLIGTFSTVRWGRIEDGRFVETTAWNTKQLEEFFCRSTDGGHTWSLPEPFPYPCRPWHPLGGDEYLGAIGVLSDPDKHRLQDGTASKSVLCLVRGRLKGSRMEGPTGAHRTHWRCAAQPGSPHALARWNPAGLLRRHPTAGRAALPGCAPL